MLLQYSILFLIDFYLFNIFGLIMKLHGQEHINAKFGQMEMDIIKKYDNNIVFID